MGNQCGSIAFRVARVCLLGFDSRPRLGEYERDEHGRYYGWRRLRRSQEAVGDLRRLLQFDYYADEDEVDLEMEDPEEGGYDNDYGVVMYVRQSRGE